MIRNHPAGPPAEFRKIVSMALTGLLFCAYQEDMDSYFLFQSGHSNR